MRITPPVHNSSIAVLAVTIVDYGKKCHSAKEYRNRFEDMIATECARLNLRIQYLGQCSESHTKIPTVFYIIGVHIARVLKTPSELQDTYRLLFDGG